MKERVTFEAWLANMMSSEFELIEKDGKQTFRRIDAEIDQVNRTLQTTESRMHKMGKRLMGAAATYFAADKIMDWGGAIVDSTAKYQRFYAVLENTLGSRTAASNAFTMIQEFAVKTPFQVDQLTDSFVKLSSQGFVPAMKDMRSLGDLAASKGKAYDQLTEAIIDAETGEFERLKEFGIRASKSGDQVTFTFKNQKTTVDFTADSIRKYILSLGDAQGVAGSMEKIMEGTGGKISNMKDNLDKLNKNLGDRYRVSIDGAITRTSQFVSVLSNWAEVPMSERLEDERTKVNLLASELVNVNTPLERRNEIYQQLSEIAPSIVSGINQEAIETGKLKDNLAEYNTQMINRIILERKREEQAQALKRQEKKMGRESASGERIRGTLTEIEDMLREDGQAVRADEINRIRMSTEDDYATQAEKASQYLRSTGGLVTPSTTTMGGQSNSIDYSNVLDIQARDYRSRAKKTKAATVDWEDTKAEADRAMIEMGLNDEPDVDEDDSGGNGNGSGSGSTNAVATVLGGISGDNRTVKNINISIGKLGTIETAEIRTDQDERDMQVILEELQKGLMTVLNDANTIAD